MGLRGHSGIGHEYVTADLGERRLHSVVQWRRKPVNTEQFLPLPITAKLLDRAEAGDEEQGEGEFL